MKKVEECINYISRPQAIFLAFLVFYVLLGMLASYVGPIDKVNLLFGADNSRAYRDIALIEADHYRVKVHPLLLLLVQPVILAMNGLTNYLPLAALLVIAIAAATMVALFSDILRTLDVSPAVRLTFTLILGLSFSNIHYASVAETFMFASLGLVAFWWYVVRIASARKGELTRSEWILLIFFGIVEFGITITNCVCYLIGLLYLLRVREGCSRKLRTFLLLNLAWFFAALLLVELQRLVWDGTPRFWGSMGSALFWGKTYEETLYMSWSFGIDKTCMWLREVFCFPLIAPDIAVNQKGWLWFQEYPLASRVAVIGFYVLFVVGLVSFIAKRTKKGLLKFGAKERIFWFIAIAFVMNAALHYIYGASEAFMYSPHYLFLLLIVGAIAVDSIDSRILKRTIIVLLVVFIFVEAVMNLVAFSETVSFINDRLQAGTSLLKAFGVCAFVDAVMALLLWRAKPLFADKTKALCGMLVAYGTLIVLVSVFIFISY